MADQGKGGGERLSQVMIVLITAVIGPISVWYVTSPSSPMHTPSETPPAQTLTLAVSPVWAETATPTVVSPGPSSTIQASATETPTVPAPTATATVTATQMNTPTSVPVLPSGSLPAGTPVVIDGMALLVSASDVSLEGSLIRVQLHLTNQSSSKLSFSYTPNAISVRDNTGRTYSVANGDGKEACKKPDLSMKKTVQIEPGQELILQPLEAREVSAWCADNKDSVLPFFTGPFSRNAKSLIIGFNGLGPFKGFAIEIIL